MKQFKQRCIECMIRIMICLTLSSAVLTAAENEIDQKLAQQMEQDYQKAIHLQRKEKKLEEALKLLEKYDGSEAVPDKLRYKILNYRIWGSYASRQFDECQRLFHRCLDLSLPNGWSKEMNVAYGPDERNLLDIYLPRGATKPVPVLVLIHGGGWGRGSQTLYPAARQRELVQKILASGGAVATITYRFVYKDHKLPAPLHDSARAIQYLRANAAKYNLDKKRFVAMGDSAGGCNTLWLATHDDLADPKAEDPVLRESSRLQGAVVMSAQTTVDPADMKAGDILEALNHVMFSNGLKYSNEKLKTLDIDAETQKLIDYCSPVKHLDSGDPPIYLIYTGPFSRDTDHIHHSKLGLLFKKRADAVGATCTLSVRNEPNYPNPEPNYVLKLLGLTEKDELK